ncbi:hypothetical protein SESBI_42841 [Sesbania bispinosa]|nr:hypothetical protein SESBI_42841 [Sesbania bispinosa]
MIFDYFVVVGKIDHLDGRMCARTSTSKAQHVNYTNIVRGMSAEVEARLRQKIAEQQQTINTINHVLARQNKLLSLFSKHVNIDLDAMDLDGDDPYIGDATIPGRDPTNAMDVDDEC